jgi:hypothetical protein
MYFVTQLSSRDGPCVATPVNEKSQANFELPPSLKLEVRVRLHQAYLNVYKPEIRNGFNKSTSMNSVLSGNAEHHPPRDPFMVLFILA